MSPARSAVLREGIWGLAVALVALAAFGVRLADEPEFVDEWAYVSQTYFWSELGRPHSTRWLEYPALDLPPLPKYVMGAALRTAGYPLPPPSRAQAWYRDIETRFGSRHLLLAARRPSAIFGALGCVAVFALGRLTFDRRVGALAAGLLIVDPLYRMLARRAMADVYAEALLLASCALGLGAWNRLLSGRSPAAGGIAAMILAGVCGGLAVLAKLNGGLALMVLTAWCGLALALGGVPGRRRGLVMLATALAGAAAFAVFVALNPFLTAGGKGPVAAELWPIAERGVIGRCAELIRHRMSVPRNQQELFPHNALTSLDAKTRAIAVQGFGRFGPLGRQRYDAIGQRWWFDSTRRYDWRQDAGAVIWLPLVVAGAVVLARRGREQSALGQPPTATALLVQTLVTLVTVTWFLPLAWDRFFLSLQPGSCLLASAAVIGLGDRLVRAPWSARTPLG